MKTHMDLLLATDILFVTIYASNHDGILGTYEFTFEDLVQAKLFTYKDLYLHCIAIVKESDFIPEYDLSDLIVDIIYSTSSNERSIKKFLSNARIAAWKKQNVSHTMQIKFSDSPEDKMLYDKLLEIDNRSEFIKSILRITFQNHVTCASSGE